MPFSESLLLHHHWADSVEQNLANRKENLAKYVRKENPFDFSGQICVNTHFALELVMLNVITFESSCVGQRNRQVGQKCKIFVVIETFECQIVSNFMDSKKGCLSGSGAYNVSGQKKTATSTPYP